MTGNSARMDQGNLTCQSVGSDDASGLAVNSPEQSPFLRLPPEIRNIIYDVSLHWPDSKTLYSGYNEQIKEYYVKKHAGVDAEFPVYSGRLSTPTILLLCKAITAECLGILKSRKLVIDRLPPWLPGAKRPMRISQFVGTATLQNLRFLEIHPAFGLGKLGSGWVWSGVVKELVEILLVRNAFERVRFVLCFHDMHRRVEPVWTQENRCYCKIFKKVRRTILLWKGDSRACYRPPARKC